ncbi:ankyrin repeat-containing domain protein, partial [Dunaliella salina]
NWKTPLVAATKEGHLDAVRLLLDKGAAIDEAEEDGWTPLCWASSRGHLEIAKLLVDRGADVSKAASVSLSCEVSLSLKMSSVEPHLLKL